MSGYNDAAKPASRGVPLKVDITSDVICPYCYIGAKRFLSAIDTYNSTHPSGHLEPRIHFLPFQLNQKLTETPVSRKENRTALYGEKRGEEVAENVRRNLATVGVTTNTDGQVSQTTLVHRLQHLAYIKIPSDYLALVLDLFESYHVNARHPSDRDALADIAVKHHLFETKDQALEWLAGTEYEKEVNEGYERARRMGVSGVPYFVLDDKWPFSGAAPEEELVKLLGQLVERRKTESA